MRRIILNIKKFAGFMRFVARRATADRCQQIAASLTFTTLLSLVPIITVAVTVFAAFPVFTELMTQVKIFMLTNLVPEKAGKVITVYMEQFSGKAAKLTMLGIAALAVTALMLMNTIDRAFNDIWRVRKPRRLVHRFLTYWAVLTIGPIVLGASLSITYYLVSFSLGYVKHMPLLGEITLRLVPAILMSLAFTLLFSAVPNRYVPFKHALVGGIVAGIAFEIMKRGFAWYITTFPTYTLVYGAFATFPIFLLWIYLSWLVVLLGAVMAASLSHWRSATWQQARLAGWQFEAALRILQLLAEAQRGGQGLGMSSLMRRVDVGLEDLEVLLAQLEQAKLVQQSNNREWHLSRAPTDIRMADVFHLFAYAPSQHPKTDAAGQQWLSALATQQASMLNATLAEVLPSAPAS